LTFIITNAICNTNKQTLVKNQCRFHCDLKNDHKSGQLPCRKKYEQMTGWDSLSGSIWTASHCYLLHHNFNLIPHWVHVLSYNSLVLQAGCVTVEWLRRRAWEAGEASAQQDTLYKRNNLLTPLYYITVVLQNCLVSIIIPHLHTHLLHGAESFLRKLPVLS
jgi:hypothetical protein